MSDKPMLVRPLQGRMIAGVCAGIARQYNLDVNLVRLVVAALAVLGVGSVGFLYLAAWAFIPEEGSGTTGADQAMSQVRKFREHQQSRSKTYQPEQPAAGKQETFDPYSDQS